MAKKFSKYFTQVLFHQKPRLQLIPMFDAWKKVPKLFSQLVVQNGDLPCYKVK